jgi:hypothetical protein
MVRVARPIDRESQSGISDNEIRYLNCWRECFGSGKTKVTLKRKKRRNLLFESARMFSLESWRLLLLLEILYGGI